VLTEKTKPLTSKLTELRVMWEYLTIVFVCHHVNIYIRT